MIQNAYNDANRQYGANNEDVQRLQEQMEKGKKIPALFTI